MSIDKIKESYAKEQGFENWSEFLNNTHGFHIATHRSKIAERYAQSQIQELTAWKESAKKVFKNLDLQAIGKTLGIGLGEDVSTNVLPKIKELKEQNAELVGMLTEIRNRIQCGKSLTKTNHMVMIDLLLTKYNHLNKKP